MTTINTTIRGNSRAAIAGRVARKVREANQWKVRTGRMPLSTLRRWARRFEAECLQDPERFAWWGDVVRR